MGEWTKNHLRVIAFLPQPHATSPREKWQAVKVCKATAKRLDLDRLTAFHYPTQSVGLQRQSREVLKSRARLPPTAALIAQAITARFAAPAATTNRRTSGCNAAPWVHKNRPAIIVRNDNLIKLGLFEPDGACSTATMKN